MIKLDSVYVVLSKDRKYGLCGGCDNEYSYTPMKGGRPYDFNSLKIFEIKTFAESAIEHSKITNFWGHREFKKYDVEVVEVERIIKV